MKVKVVSDGACDLPIDLIKKYDIDIIKISINDGITEYVEHESIEPDELYKNIVKGTIYKTSQVSVYDLKQCFEKYIKEDRPVLFISLSSAITGGCNSAFVVRDELLEKYPHAKLHICDSYCATTGQALATLRCAAMAMDGAEFEKVVEAMEFYKKHQDHLWTITNFEYLIRGGRLSKGKAAIGGMLNIRPIMEMNKNKGTLEPIDKVRGEKMLMRKICEYMEKRSGGHLDTNQNIVVTYAANYDLRDALVNEISKKFNIPKDAILCWQMGCVVGSYIGPDFVGVFFLNELRNDGYDKIDI